jgi:predicted RNA-binding Zn ribbon-like protein
MISRKIAHPIKALLLVPHSGAEQAHVALVNLPGEAEAVDAYINRHEFGGKPMQRGMVRLVRDSLRKAWSGDKEALQWAQGRLDAGRFNVTYKMAHLLVEPTSLMGMVCLLVLRDHAAGKTAVCANPGCHTPYFIQKRKTQKFCESGPCTEQAQREQKREWWNRHRGKGAK